MGELLYGVCDKIIGLQNGQSFTDREAAECLFQHRDKTPEA